MKRTFTVTHIQRPFMTTKDSHDFKYFYRRIDFFSTNEQNERLFHWQNISVKAQDEAAFNEMQEKKMLIELPTPIEISEGKCLWMYLGSYLYIADAKDPSENDMQLVCKLANCWETMPGPSRKDDRQYMDIVVIKHLLTPAEGYPTEPGLLRAMTFVTTTLTEDTAKNYHFGPKNYYVRDREIKWEKWKEEGRIIDLPVPLLYKPKDTNIHGFVVGEEGFWTDSTKTHHFGIVPQEAKCFFITHIKLLGKRPFTGYIARRHYDAGYYYIFDVGETESWGGDGSMSHHFTDQISELNAKESETTVYVTLPQPYRRKKGFSTPWVDSKGNIYMGHADKPNENPYEFIMHSPVLESLPMEKEGNSSGEYVDFKEMVS